MTTSALPTRARLARHQCLQFRPRRPLRLQSERGTLWVTIDGWPDDIEIDAGQSRVFAAGTVLTVGTLGGAAEFSARNEAGPR